MKKTIIYFFALLPLASLAQVDRTKAPKPTAAPEITIGKPATFVLPNGLKVFVVQNNKLPRVSANLFFDIDPIIEGDKAGLTSLAGSLVRRGTTTMNKAKLDEEIDFLGASINTSANGVYIASLKNNFSKVFALMSDVVLRPSLPAAELEKLRKQSLSGLQAAKDDPNSIATNVSHRLVYGKDHPYGDIETEKTLANVSLADVKNYFATYWKPNIAYLVFVGDITTAEAKVLATKYLATWKKGIVPKPSYKTPQAPAKTYVAVVDRPSSVQSVIKIVAPIQLKPGAPDAIAASVVNNVLGGGSSGRLFLNLRERHGFTYGAYSKLSSDKLVGYFSADAAVRNEKTDSSIAEFLSEFNTIGSKVASDTDVMNTKNYLSGNFARSLEDPATIADFALDIARYNLPADYYQNYLKNLSAVSPQTVQAVATKYVQPEHMHIIVVGNAKEITNGLEKYGPIKYFDVYGNEVAAPTTKKMDASVTAQSILAKAAAAAGTPQAIAAIKDISMTGEASVAGQSLAVSQKVLIPSAYMFSVSMGPMALQKKMLKDGKYTMSQQGQEKAAEAKDIEEMNEDAAYFSDAYLLKQTGYTFDVAGIEKVEGKDAYALNIKTPAGRSYTNYYDVTSGLKVKTTTVADAGPAGQINVQTYISDYKTFNGVQIPTTMTVDQGQFKIVMTFKDIKVNSGLTANDIK